jgi:hypothetical protein
MAPVVLLALPLLPSAPWSALKARARWGLLGLLAVNSLSSAFMLQERTVVASTHFNYYHLRTAELDAFAWLGQNAKPQDVILADYLDGNRLGRFVSARVTLGHYSVTPNSKAVEALVEQLLGGRIDAAGARRLFLDWRVRWIYYSPRANPDFPVDRWPWCVRRYRERGIAIYECDASQESPKAGGSRAGGLEEATPSPKR